jgi:polar amino acid transport system substrate-binding protein
MHTRNTWLASALAVGALTAFAAAGCGSDNKTSSSSSTPGAPAAASIDVPAAVKSKGTLKIATDPTYAPNEFVANDGRTLEGMDVDLGNALIAALGLKAEFVKAGFDAIIPGLASKKYDLSLSSFTDTKEREGTVDFVTYFTAGTSFYVKAQGGPTVNALTDLCGKKVAVEKGTTQGADATAQSKKCKAAGQPAVNVSQFPDQNGANLALSSGRAQVGMADSPVAAYIVKQSGGQFKLTGQPYGTAPYGIAIPKGSGLAQPILLAMRRVIKDGTYSRILNKWGVSDGAITTPVINGATS